MVLACKEFFSAAEAKSGQVSNEYTKEARSSGSFTRARAITDSVAESFRRLSGDDGVSEKNTPHHSGSGYQGKVYRRLLVFKGG